MLEKKAYYAFSSALFFFRNLSKIMLLSENYALCHRDYATWILRKIKITSSLTLLINFNFNDRSYSPPSSLTVFSIANAHVRTLRMRLSVRHWKCSERAGSGCTRGSLTLDLRGHIFIWIPASQPSRHMGFTPRKITE